jgi:Glutaredoxin and related proteins
MKYTIYTREGCSNCDKTKQLLNEKNISFEEKDIDRYKKVLLESYPSLRELPVIFCDGKLVSYSELQKNLGK